MGLSVKMDSDAMIAELRNIAQRANSNAARTLKRASIRVRDLAKQYAPKDTGSLEESLDYGDRRDTNGRNVYLVFVTGDYRHKGGKKMVGQYADIMENELTPYGKYKLGSGSQTKADSGKAVGGKFLERAVDKVSESITDEMMAAARAALSASSNGRAR
jgi:hypothetical protein